jgi:hypothetical protein
MSTPREIETLVLDETAIKLKQVLALVITSSF